MKQPAGVSRGQNAVHVMPWDWTAAEQVLGTLVDRIDISRAEPQLLIVTADAENAAQAAAAIVRIAGDHDERGVGGSARPRAARLPAAVRAGRRGATQLRATCPHPRMRAPCRAS